MTGNCRSLTKKIPSYLHHKSTGQARVRIDGKDIYLGKFGSPESRVKYGEVIARASVLQPDAIVEKPADPLGSTPASGITINELVCAFMKFAEKHYVKNGQPTSELDCFKSAMRPFVELYGFTDAEKFGPLALKAVRTKMIEFGWSRKYVNKSVGRIRSVYRFGVENELILDSRVLERLRAVAPLLRGRCEAPDHPARDVVEQAHVDAVKAVVPERTADLIDLLLLTGARPGELIALTGAVIDQTRDIWIAELEDHKMIHHGKRRFVVFGPKAQVILKKYMLNNPNERMFKITRKWFGMAIAAACVKANVPHWTPHWLRHTAASHIREEFGLDAAQIILGHSSATMTEIYAHLNVKQASKIARKRG